MNVKEAAQFHVDKHIVKMPLETAQMLCTNLNSIGVQSPYLSVHRKHPCTLWAGMSRTNYNWLCQLGLALCEEYSYRYKKVHSCESIIKYCMQNRLMLPKGDLTELPQAMPDEYKCDNSILAYRNYYIFGKKHLHQWTGRPIPEWIVV
jgi:hypothetical protein